MTWPINLARSTIGVAAIATLTAGLYVGGAGAQDRLPDYPAIIAAPDRLMRIGRPTHVEILRSCLSLQGRCRV